MAEIEIFLSINDSQISFLSIPRSDIERLAVSPFHWLSYVVFAICGARGDLSTTPNGPAVDYENTEIANDEITYYYRPSQECAFVDSEGLNDRLTSTVQTPRRAHFRDVVIKRDGPACVITQEKEGQCDAAHLIPHSKGDEYIEKVMQIRSPGDNLAPGIDDIVNRILPRQDLHTKLSKGLVAFIKTPNGELRPEHIKRFPRGDERQAYITLQWIKKFKNYDPKMLDQLQAIQNAGINPSPKIAHDALQNVDALFLGEGVPLPSDFILDYIYGIAAYKAWRSNRVNDLIMDDYRKVNYTKIPPKYSAPPDDMDTDVTSGPEDRKDTNCIPPGKQNRHTPTRRSGLEETMDELNMFLMYIHGITPEMAAERRQKKIEREERAAQEASRSKVMEWRNHLDVY